MSDPAVLHFRASIIFACLSVVLSGCGGGSGSDAGGNGNSGTAQQTQTVVASSTVGSSGGTVSVTDPGSPLFGTSVTIPAGALISPEDVTISSLVPGFPAPEGTEFAGPIVVFGPAGLTFQQPVTITLPSARSFSETQSDLIHLFFDGNWTLLADPTNDESHGDVAVDPVTNLMSYQTTHFSPWARLRKSDLERIFANGLGVRAILNYIEGRCIDQPPCGSRPVAISEIIVHSTNSPDGATFPAEVFFGATNKRPLAFDKNKKPLFNKDGSRKRHPTTFAHYYIDHSGGIAQVAPDHIRAPHTGGNPPDGAYNDRAIGIELFQPRKPNGVAAEYSDYKEPQLIALVRLTRELMKKYDISVSGIHRHKKYAPGDDFHQDPFGWSDGDWERFLSVLTPIGNTPIEPAWKRMALPYELSGTLPGVGCFLVERLSNDGISSGGSGGGGLPQNCGTFREWSPFDLAKNGYDLFMTPTKTYFKLVQAEQQFLGNHGLTIQQVTGSLRIDQIARRTEYVSLFNGQFVDCSSTDSNKNHRGALSIEAESVYLVRLTGIKVLLGPLPIGSEQFPLLEIYTPNFLVPGGVLTSLQDSRLPGTQISAIFGKLSHPQIVWYSSTGSTETKCFPVDL